MLITYTPDQQLLFDQDIASWSREPKGWYRHASGGRLHLMARRQSVLGEVVYTLKASDGDCIAVVTSPGNAWEADRPRNMATFLLLLQTLFSEDHRRRMDAFVRTVSWKLLLQGCRGRHVVRMETASSGHILPGVMNAAYALVPAVLSPDLVAEHHFLRWTPAPTGTTLQGRLGRVISILLPDSAHGALALLQNIQNTPAWAQPLA